MSDKNQDEYKNNIIHRIFYSREPCTVEDFLKYFTKSDQEKYRDAIQELIDEGMIVISKHPNKPKAKIYTIPKNKSGVAQRIVGLMIYKDYNLLTQKFPPITTRRTTIVDLTSDNSGNITQIVEGKVIWGFLNSYHFNIYSDGEIDTRILNLKAKDLKNNKKLDRTLEIDADKYKRIKVLFDDTIIAGKDFEIEISYFLKGVLRIKKDWYSNKSTSSEALMLEIRFPKGVMVKNTNGSTITISDGMILNVEEIKDFIKEPIKIDKKNHRDTIIWKIPNPIPGAEYTVRWETEKY